MDRERLARLLEEPGKVSKEDLSDLKALTERFPWFSGAHLLRAVGEQTGGDVLADGSLHNSVAHLPSRAVLFDLRDVSMEQAAAELQQQRTTTGPTSVLTEKETDGTKAGQETTMTVVPSEEEEELPAAIGDATPAPAEPAEVIPVDKPSAHEVPEEEQEQEEIETTETDAVPAADTPVEALVKEEIAEEATEVKSADTVPEELERQILEAALASAYDLTWQEQLLERKKEKEPKSSARAVEPQADRPTENPEGGSASITSPAPPSATANVTPGARLKFTDWLVAAVPTERTPAAQVAARNVPDVVHKENVRTGKPEPPATPDLLDTRNINESYIEHETPARVSKADFYTPQQAAKKSLDDSAGMVSETLAKIYEKQGNLPKAIEAYRKLALKYPEKSAYFGALSKSLEEKLNA